MPKLNSQKISWAVTKEKKDAAAGDDERAEKKQKKKVVEDNLGTLNVLRKIRSSDEVASLHCFGRGYGLLPDIFSVFDTRSLIHPVG